MANGPTNKDVAKGEIYARPNDFLPLKPRFEQRIKLCEEGHLRSGHFLLVASSGVTPVGMEMHDMPPWLSRSGLLTWGLDEHSCLRTGTSQTLQAGGAWHRGGWG